MADKTWLLTRQAAGIPCIIASFNTTLTYKSTPNPRIYMDYGGRDH